MISITNPQRFFMFLLAVFLIPVFILLIFFYFTVARASIQKSGELEIAPGTTGLALWQQLVDQDFTSSTLPWRYHDWRSSASSQLKPGLYSLTDGASVRATLEMFVTGVNPDELTLTIPEGYTLEQISRLVADQELTSASAFQAAAVPSSFKTEFPILNNIPTGRDLEGYLFPDTYHLFIDDTADDILKRLVANFSQKMTPDLIAEIEASQRTLDQIIIMASIIEREVISDQDMALVSGVLWNRFDTDQGLGADATVRYILNNWDQPLTVQDLQIDSPYNTRRYKGLPPGPISNPGLRAIIAAIRPAETDYFYYLSAPDGTTHFAETLEGHNVNKAKYLTNTN